MYEVYVAAQFEAAHRLVGELGSATRLHGHTYRMEVMVRGERIKDDGTLYDIGQLRPAVDELAASLHYRDLNDVPEAQTSLLLNGPAGSEIDTLGFDRADAGDDVRLFNLAPLIPQERRYSRIERGRPELLDQILASVECFPAREGGERRLPQADSLVDFRERLPSVTNDPGERDRDVAPDHAPVTARFDF